MSHTKGKVAVDSRETLVIRDDAGGLIAILTHLKGPCGLGGRRNDQEVEDNARRLAALWNAAEDLGLTTEEIEKGAILKMFWLAGYRAPGIDMSDMEFMVPIWGDEIEFHPWKGGPMKVSVRGGENTQHVRDEIMRRWNKIEVILK